MGKMSMRVGNRLNSTIVRARMKRIAKTKTFTTKQQRTQKSTSGSSGQSISQLLSKLNANSGKTSSAEQLLANRTQTLLYSGMETAAERVEKRLGKFLKTDGTSVFDEEDETKLKENVTDHIESFVNDYNYLMKRLAQSGDIVDSNYAKKLKNYANAENKELREIGITIKGDGTLELDENKLKAAEKIPMAEAEVTMIPQNYVELTAEEDLTNINRILDLLDDDDDVQEVYHNWDE